MNKKDQRGYIVLGIIFVVFTVVAFAVPFSKKAGFWLGYVFGIIAIAFQLYIFKISFAQGEDVKSKFYGFPIARIGVIYLGAQMLFSILEMATAKFLLTWVAVLVNIVVLAFALVGCIAADIMRDEIVRQDVKLEKDVTNMRRLQSLSASLVGLCQDENAKKTLQDIADEFKYSDPVSSEQTKEMEEDMKMQLEELQSAVLEGDVSNVPILCAKLKNRLIERNHLCATSK